MSLISTPLLLAGGGGYQISRSVRTRGAYPTTPSYFSRIAGTPTNNLKWTFSFWAKQGVLSVGQNLLNAGTGTSASEDYLAFFATQNRLAFVQDNAATTYLSTAQLFRDPSAWYHIIFVYDSAQATASNRAVFYVNGVQVTAFNVATYPTLNQASKINSNGVLQRISSRTYLADEGFDGYLAEMNFIDGQALTPSSFGATNIVTGVWAPKKYAGTYGTNGFYLNFSDNSAATATTIGKDYSGNGNNWTPTNISVTAGVTYDSMIDTPTPYADGGNGRGNYCVLNPLQTGVAGFFGAVSKTYADGNLNISWGTGSYFGVTATIALPSTGKWYWEAAATTNKMSVGISASYAETGSASEINVRVDSTNIYANGSTVQSGLSNYTTEILGIAWDADVKTIQFYKSGALYGTAQSYVPTNGVSYYPFAMATSSGASCAGYFNFGQRPFSYTPPTGFKALNTQNLPASTIVNGAAYMAATLYTGTSVAQSIVNTVNGVSFQPDLVWGKNRTNVNSHRLTDVNRGVGKVLFSNTTNGDTTGDGQLSSFNSNGFGLTGGAGSFEGLNQSGNNYVAWQWKASGAPVTNTAGSITSQVSAGVTQGFSIVTYTGTGAVATVGHGLGVAPKMVIVKRRDAAAQWDVYHASIGATGRLYLNATDATNTSAAPWNNTAPTSTVFTIGTATDTNASGSAIVAYCFSEVAGFSKFGSYTGNGSADGPFVFTGFLPRWVMIKRTDSTSSWLVIDTTRQTYNVQGPYLVPNTSDAETTGTTVLDVVSNGFKSRSSSTLNTNGGTYIFAAFAENPFKNALAR